MENFDKIINEIKKVIKGKDNELRLILAVLLAKGNVLIEDIPGTGKTTVAKAFSKVLGLTGKRIQLTSDTLPSDITGFSVYDKNTGKFKLQRGPVFCNILFADELNRTSGRTQSALLEAMEEHQVTIDGKTHSLIEPFSVIATQNPKSSVGTMPIPDSQLDRFSIAVSLGYPDRNSLFEILSKASTINDMDIQQIVTVREFLDMQELCKKVYVNDKILWYIVDLIDATRNSPDLEQGASSRAMVSVLNIAKVIAYSKGRDYVVPEDVQDIFALAISHRIKVNRRNTTESAKIIADKILKSIKAPGVINE